MSTPFTVSVFPHRDHCLLTTAKSIFKPPARWGCTRFNSAPSRSSRRTWKRWAFRYCRRLWSQPSQAQQARRLDRIRKLSFPRCFKEDSRKKACGVGSLVRRLFLARCLRRIRATLQSLELLHFMLCACRFPLFPIEARQPEMRLRRQRTIFFDREELGPFFLGSDGIAVQRSSFPQRIECLRHVRHQLVRAQKFCPRLVHFALL